MREERAPDQPPAMPGPAIRRCALRYPPYACDPTAGGRDGISVNDNTCEFPPTTPQDGMATCSVRRQPAPDRQGNHGGEYGLASSPGDGAEETRPGLLPHSWLEETSLKAWPTRMAPTQYVDGMAAATGEPSPCPGGDHDGTRGMACETRGEAEFPELGLVRNPLRHTAPHVARPMEAAGRSWAEDGLAAPARTLPNGTLSDARDRRREEMPAGCSPAEAPYACSPTAPHEARPCGVPELRREDGLDLDSNHPRVSGRTRTTCLPRSRTRWA